MDLGASSAARYLSAVTSALRRLARVLALVLAAVVAGETLDVLPCADEVGTPAAHTDAAGAHGAGTHGDGADGADTDCLCHLSYVPAAVPASVAAAPPAPTGRFAPYAGRAQGGVRRVLHPPPLG